MVFRQLFNKLPIRDNYRETKNSALVLRASPTVARLCLVVEIIVCVAVFTLSYYSSASSSTTETTISFEPLESPYTCSLLSPRSDAETLALDTYEYVAFSKARLTYTQCETLLTNGDFCGEEVQQHKLGIQGLSVDDDTCYDIILTAGYRFCKTTESFTNMASDTVLKAFPSSSTSPAAAYADSFHYVNTLTAEVHSLTVSFQTTEIISSFISDQQLSVFVIAATTQRASIYHFHPSFKVAKELQSIDGATSTSVYGFAFGNQALFILFYLNYQGSILRYNLTTTAWEVGSAFIDCKGLQSTDDVGGTDASYMSYGSDDNLHVMCTTQTEINTAPPASQTYSFPLNKVPATKPYSYQRIYANFSYLTYSGSNGRIDKIKQAIYHRGYYVFSTGSNAYNLLQARASDLVNNQLKQIQVIGRFNGTSLLAYNDVIYCLGSNEDYYNPASRQFFTFGTEWRKDMYFATYVKHGYSGQICNGNYSKYLVDFSTSTDFSSSCAELNGIYYQNTQFISVPSTCTNAINKVDDAALLWECSALEDSVADFVETSCLGAVDSICDAEYTENPPFSCQKKVYASTLTNFSTAFANASGVWSLLIILIRLLLRAWYFHFFEDFEYDEARECYVEKGELLASHVNVGVKVCPENGNLVRADDVEQQYLSREDESDRMKACKAQ